MLQRYPAVSSGPVAAPAIVHDAPHSPGKQLDKVTPDSNGTRAGYDFSQVHTFTESGGNSAAALPSLTNQPLAQRETATIDVLNRATSEAGQPIHEPLRSSLGERFRHDFTQVRVHSGPASAEAAARVSARAYTLGTDIHLGAEAHGLTGPEFDRLLAHEAVHTVQQGGHTVAPYAGLTVSDPADAAEQEAERMAESITADSAVQTPSRSLALRDQMRASMPGQVIARSVSPHIQRDITGKYPAGEGEFALDLKKTQTNPGPQVGLLGTIKFTANEKAPDSDSIRLLQVVKTENLATGKDLVWSGGEANRNKVMTEASPGVAAGWFVDHSAAAAKQRSAKGDPAVSPYYRDYWPNATMSQDGSKKGKTVKDASLADNPGSTGNIRFSFETVAKATDTGHVYGTIMWGFAITDAAKGKIENERAVGRGTTSLSTDKAIDKFNEFYKNPGAATAP
jgi:hypothetical protein